MTKFLTINLVFTAIWGAISASFSGWFSGTKLLMIANCSAPPSVAVP